MTDIMIRPAQLRATSHSLRQHAKTIQAQIQNVDHVIHSLQSNFEGHQAREISQRYHNIRACLFNTWKIITKFAEKLEDIADRFEDADRRLAQNQPFNPGDLIRKIIESGLKPGLIGMPWLIKPELWSNLMKFRIPGWPQYSTLPWRPIPAILGVINLRRIPLPVKITLPDFKIPDWFKIGDHGFTPVPNQLPPSSGKDFDSAGFSTFAQNPPAAPAEVPAVPNFDVKVKKSQDTIAALDVVNTTKYIPNHEGKGWTYCNIFASDYANKMGAPLPQHLDWNSDNTPDRYLNANRMVQWLRGDFGEGGGAVQQGPALGWQRISADQAAVSASQGHVVLAGWQNPAGLETSGHLAVVRPESTPGNIHIAQAGGRNFNDGTVTQGFGSRNVEYFVYSPNAPVAQ